MSKEPSTANSRNFKHFPVMSLSTDETLDILDEIETKCDSWLNSRASRFDPFNWSEARNRHARRKAFNEASLYLYVSHQLGFSHDVPDIEDLVRKRVNTREYCHLMQRKPREYLKFAYAVAYLSNRDTLDPRVDGITESILDEGVVWSVERPPYRMMDLWHFCRMYDYEQDTLDSQRILENSCLQHPPNPVYSDVRQAYALTHNLLFYHNFGVPHPNFPKHPAPYDLTDVLPALLVRFVAEDDLDVALELVTVGVLQQQLSPELVWPVMSLVAKKVQEHGYVPGPERAGSACGIQRGSDQPEDNPSNEDEEHWKQHYHTNLVAGMTARILRDRWQNATEQSLMTTNGADYTFEALTELGQLLVALSEYDLRTSAQLTIELADSSVARAYDTVFDTAVSFLRAQKTTDGEYGYWTDEKQLYLCRESSVSSLKNGAIAETTELCAKALEVAEGTNHE